MLSEEVQAKRVKADATHNAYMNHVANRSWFFNPFKAIRWWKEDSRLYREAQEANLDLLKALQIEKVRISRRLDEPTQPVPSKRDP